jgi:hypothetical protein
MIIENSAELRERIERFARRPVRRDPAIVEDASNYLQILGGMVLRVGGDDLYVLGDAREGRFGISEQPKFWVKRVIDLADGSTKIVKLVFHEQFTLRLGLITVRCHRSPDKESEVLRAVDGDARFMQGRTVVDRLGNNIRIIDFIRGDTFFNYIATLDQSHEEYFHETLPGVIRRLLGSIEAMDALHHHGLDHGDIRNDHILIEHDSGAYRWIDFDYSVNYSDYDVWSMGNVLNYAVAKGIVTCRAAGTGEVNPGFRGSISPDDALLFYGYRVANLRKVFPYIPAPLNELLMAFSAGAEDFFESFDQLGRVLRAVADETWGSPAVSARG